MNTNHDDSSGFHDSSDSRASSDSPGTHGSLSGHGSHGSSAAEQITLRGPAELADALPFMLGFHPSDSVVLVALHGEHGRFGGRVRVGIPDSPREWPAIAEHLADCLVEGAGRRGERPDAIVVFLCQEPGPGETGRRVMERLRPFAQRLRTTCGALDIPVLEALCISDGLYFSYCCPDLRCCPPDGTPLALSGTSVMAASAAYAGLQVRGTLKDMEARLKPAGTEGEAAQRAALNEAATVIVPRILEGPASGLGRQETRETTLGLVRRLIERFAGSPEIPAPRSAGGAGAVRPRLAGQVLTVPGAPTGTSLADARDDELLTPDEAATLILGLQDRDTRDQAAEWMEGPEAVPVLRLWRALSRRCVPPYQEYAAAPLTLAGWVAWSLGDEPSARVALGLALEADSDYLFARLLHQACNEGLDPEALRECLRKERDARLAAERRRGEPGPGRGTEPGIAPDSGPGLAAGSDPGLRRVSDSDLGAPAGSDTGTGTGTGTATGAGVAGGVADSAPHPRSGSGSGTDSGTDSGSGEGDDPVEPAGRGETGPRRPGSSAAAVRARRRQRARQTARRAARGTGPRAAELRSPRRAVVRRTGRRGARSGT
ncbi:DUF4192 domain-containing protein [Streptomyces roseicoloratus]|uniref:DUF4192 domain-containing protein n=1 Tax=Streptomyces roseicoloratus TaxID=2508722 RepID=UPI001C679238|nr:DUF4192 domain-containing protein [Streptomyces roseicoloratus]